MSDFSHAQSPDKGASPATASVYAIPEPLLTLAGADELPDGAEDTALETLYAAAHEYALASTDSDHAWAELMERHLGVYLSRALASLVLDYETRTREDAPGSASLHECGKTAVSNMHEVAARDGWTAGGTA